MLKKLLEEIKNSDYKELEFNDWEIYASQHSIERNLQRLNINPTDFVQILKEMVMFFDTCQKCQNSEYLVYSKKYKQGIIVDLFKEDQRIKIVTILPPKKQKLADNKTQKIYLENLDLNFYDKDLTEYAIQNKDIFYVDLKNNHIDISLPIIILEKKEIF